jgi:AdoMet-dependent rRNA methyltransferase SPB1
MDDELRIQKDLERLKEQSSKSRKKQRRAENERKQKEITRLQMNMVSTSFVGFSDAYKLTQSDHTIRDWS